MPREHRTIFNYMLAFCEIVNPQVMFDGRDDVRALYLSKTVFTAGCSIYLFDLLDSLLDLQHNIRSYIQPPMDHPPLPLDNHMDPRFHECEGEQLYSQLNDDQRVAPDQILLSFTSTYSKLHFIDDPGRSGKTFLYIALNHIFR
ncbi:hypothetical protein Q1695_015387 [Nippostrongylus brasiliensis]|nr:hypothetical protein Q1695_015387 [Nippostrongylus brasiliensis]